MLLAMRQYVRTYMRFMCGCVRVWLYAWHARTMSLLFHWDHEKEGIHECVIYRLYVCVRVWVVRKSEVDDAMCRINSWFTWPRLYIYMYIYIHIRICRGSRGSLAQEASWYCVPFTYLWRNNGKVIAYLFYNISTISKTLVKSNKYLRGKIWFRRQVNFRINILKLERINPSNISYVKRKVFVTNMLFYLIINLL